MDEGLSRAVREVFVQLYEEGLIYRGDYIINWCPRCHTALADLEVEHEELDSRLYYIRYPFEAGEGHVVIATTRPETLLGDTAVAVNPEDDRYRSLSGKRVLLPVLMKPIPLIFDRYVDKEFGTGALKITPAHDPNDFVIGDAHGLERIKVIDEQGRMNALAGPYAGMERFECRRAILEDLEKSGLLERTEPYKHAVGHCYRCKTMIEPILSKQWFVKVAPLAEKAVRAVREGRTRIYPPNWEAVYYEWMNNIKDWCISRQIWWGHRIPAWYCGACGEVLVSKEAPRACAKCGSDALHQETDVLDTWFSSALWPFSTLGWPDATDELRSFYPTSVLVTGFDILFFWVARMMMMGLHFRGEVPFRDVYIHALVRDAEGKKMSKSKGNVIDPLEVMDRFGTDAFRFTLAALAAQGRDVKLSEDRILGYRHFVNKIWNAARFTLMNLEGDGALSSTQRRLTLPDRWILTRLGQVSQEVAQALEEYRFNDAANACYHFVWHELCDWYLEMVKPALYGNDPACKASTRGALLDAMAGAVKLLHPFMPFVTEEIWQRLPGTQGSVMQADFPDPARFPRDDEALEHMGLVMDLIGAVRNIRGEMGVPPSKKVHIVVDAVDAEKAALFQSNMDHIRNLAKVEDAALGVGMAKPEASASAVFGGNQVHVILKGILDFEEEKRRLRREIEKAAKDLDGASRKLANRGFVENAAPDIVSEMRERAGSLAQRVEKLKENLRFFEGIDA
jgi:valyl-tRNA synthetase